VSDRQTDGETVEQRERETGKTRNAASWDGLKITTHSQMEGCPSGV